MKAKVLVHSLYGHVLLASCVASFSLLLLAISITKLRLLGVFINIFICNL